MENIATDKNSMVIRVNAVKVVNGNFEVLPNYYFVNAIQTKCAVTWLLAFDTKGLRQAPQANITRFFATDSLLYTALSRQPIKIEMHPEDFPKGYFPFGVFDVSSEMSTPVALDTTYSYVPEDFDETGHLKYASEVLAGDGDYYYRFYSSAKQVLFQPE